jgi:hypothetical protein
MDALHDPDFVISPCGSGFIACYREEDWEEFFGEAFGHGPTEDLAVADLVTHHPREVRQ